jgi:SAM-dependent methyltransferase
LAESSVLEVGAGIGDHTSFFLDRGCRVTVTEARPGNLEVIRKRYPEIDARVLDLDNPGNEIVGLFDIVYCYGTLYHLKRPAKAISFMAKNCAKLLLLETCVSYGEEALLNPVEEPSYSPSQAVSGTGCRPSRRWVYDTLKEHFDFVYLPLTQPWHEEFPVDWTRVSDQRRLTRAVFVAAREPLDLPSLSERIPMKQGRA